MLSSVFCVLMHRYTSLTPIFIASHCGIIIYIFWCICDLCPAPAFTQMSHFLYDDLNTPISITTWNTCWYYTAEQKARLLSFLCLLIQLHFKSFNAPTEAGLNETTALKSWFLDVQEWSDSSHPHKVPECLFIYFFKWSMLLDRSSS